jgi:hypothetical protein
MTKPEKPPESRQRWFIGVTIDAMLACEALGIPPNIHHLTYRLAEIQGALYRGSNGWLGARSHAGTWH